MSCVACAGVNGIHEAGCPALVAAWDGLTGQKKRDLGTVLEARGYEVLFSVGFGTHSDGTHSIKIAAYPGVRHISPPTWRVMRETIIDAIDKLVASELDDLEFER